MTWFVWYSEANNISAIADALPYSGVFLGVLSGKEMYHGMDAASSLGCRHTLEHGRYATSGAKDQRTETRGHHFRYRRDDTVPPDSSAFRWTEMH